MVTGHYLVQEVPGSLEAGNGRWSPGQRVLSLDLSGTFLEAKGRPPWWLSPAPPLPMQVTFPAGSPLACFPSCRDSRGPGKESRPPPSKANTFPANWHLHGKSR